MQFEPPRIDLSSIAEAFKDTFKLRKKETFNLGYGVGISNLDGLYRDVAAILPESVELTNIAEHISSVEFCGSSQIQFNGINGTPNYIVNTASNDITRLVNYLNQQIKEQNEAAKKNAPSPTQEL